MFRHEVAERLSEMQDLSNKCSRIVLNTLPSSGRYEPHEIAAVNALVSRIADLAKQILEDKCPR